nr:hypothetical protein [Verminephrobacter aporrectodeae]
MLPTVEAAAVVETPFLSVLCCCVPIVTLRPPPLKMPDFFSSLNWLSCVVWVAAWMRTLFFATSVVPLSLTALLPVRVMSRSARMVVVFPENVVACAVV